MQNILRPARNQLLGLFGIVLAVVSGGLRDFVLADLRDGMISTKGFSRTTKLLVWFGFGLLLSLISVLLLSDVIRQSSPLLFANMVATAGRGTAMPLVLAPFVMMMVAVALSYVLTGALHAHWLIRVSAIVVAVGIGGLYATMISDEGYTGIVIIILTLAVPVFFLLRWRAALRPSFEFGVLLTLQFGIALAGQIGVQQMWQRWHIPAPVMLLSGLQGSITYLLLPVLMVAGIDITNFVRQAAGWTADIIRARLPVRAVGVALVLALAWRLASVGMEFAEELTTWSTGGLLSYAGALLVPLLLLCLWLVIQRLAASSKVLEPDGVARAGEANALRTVVVYIGVLASTVLPSIGIVPLMALLVVRDDLAGMRALDAWQATYSSDALINMLRPLFFGLCVLVGLWMARRGRREIALFLGAIGVLDLYALLQHTGQPLAALRYYGESPVDFWLILVVLGCLVIWFARGTLTPERAGRLLFVLVGSGLMRQTAFIGDQFSPLYSLLGVGGISVVAFGLLWGALTAGAWANKDSRRLPRTGRVFLYIGVTLLTATMIILTQSTHNLGEIEQFGGMVAQTGLSMFGMPLLYAVILTTLLLPKDHADRAKHQEGVRDEG